MPAGSSYDPCSRTVTVDLPAWAGSTVDLTVTRGLRDAAGLHLAAPQHATVSVG